MLRYCMKVWWERIGATRASGITKLIISEARNFPEIAAFYQQEVIEPGQKLIRRILQRGVDRGEFRVVDMDYAIVQHHRAHGVPDHDEALAGRLRAQGLPLDPERYHRCRRSKPCCTGFLVRPDDGNDKPEGRSRK